VFLPETTAREAEAVTHRIQQRIARSPIPCEAHSLSPRMTFGIAESAAGQTLDALLHRADRALYRGKSSGKDRVVVAS
jgi:diguanylate cyclase (GGDEF)-like protein